MRSVVIHVLLLLVDGSQRIQPLHLPVGQGLPKKELAVNRFQIPLEIAQLLSNGFIELGENFFSNHNLVILDCGKVTFGDNVFVAPDCGFYTAGHPIDYERRNQGLEYAYPITVGDNVWIGAGVQVMPGVNIGSNVVIGGGSVVVKDIPSNSVAVGNPCKVIRPITEDDKKTYWDR